MHVLKFYSYKDSRGTYQTSSEPEDYRRHLMLNPCSFPRSFYSVAVQTEQVVPEVDQSSVAWRQQVPSNHVQERRWMSEYSR